MDACDTDQLCTAVNCSIGRPPGAPDFSRAERLKVNRIELWWPWDMPEPHSSQIDELAAELDRRRVQLIAVNYWGGEPSRGERGVLHQQNLSRGHLDAMARLSEKTGARMHNLLLGRGGRGLTSEQLDRVAHIAEEADARGATVLVEPSKGAADYPVQTIADAIRLIDSTPGAALLIDFWHLAAQDGTEGIAGVDRWLAQVQASGILPAHVQVADAPGRGKPGSGVLALGQWIAALRVAGYAGDIAGEWMW